MDIKQLSYFVAIVDNKFNISITSKKLHVSQPALSKAIKSFEEKECTELFIRNNGRLKSLTQSGEIFYNNAKQILKQYDDMINELRSSNKVFKGKIRIGIPPLVLGVVFSKVITNLILNNPDIDFQIIESGAQDLRKLFLLGEIDLAILLKPTNISKNLVIESAIYKDELSAFMPINHHLAIKDTLSWEDLNNEKISIFNNSFMIHHILVNQFKVKNISPIILLQSTSWDFLLQSAKNSGLITILPSPIKNIISKEKIVERKFYNPLFWEVTLCRPIKETYSYLEEYIYITLLEAFSNKHIPI